MYLSYNRSAEIISEVYNSTNTMALPGEVETDFSTQLPLWDRLNLPIGPKYYKGKGLEDAIYNQQSQQLKEVKEKKNVKKERDDREEISQINPNHSPKKVDSSHQIDWENFDFASVDTTGPEQTGISIYIKYIFILLYCTVLYYLCISYIVYCTILYYICVHIC